MKFTLRSVLDPYVDIDLGPGVDILAFDAGHAALKTLEALGLMLVSPTEIPKTTTTVVEILPSGMMRETEAAKYLGLAVNTLRRLRTRSKREHGDGVTAHKCPRYCRRKTGGVWYKQSDLDKWLDIGASDRPIPEWKKRIIERERARFREYTRKKKEEAAKTLAQTASE